MALTERNRQNGWRHQAAGLVTAHTALGTTAMAAVEQGKPLLKRNKAAPQASDVEFDFKLGERKIGVANELEDARAEIARLEQRLLQEMGATRALNERAQTLTATAAAADKRAEGLQSELDAARARLQANVDLASENSRVSRSLTEKDAALDDARTRIKFLEAALTAAEAECTRLAAEMSGARDKHGAEFRRSQWPSRNHVVARHHRGQAACRGKAASACAHRGKWRRKKTRRCVSERNAQLEAQTANPRIRRKCSQ